MSRSFDLSDVLSVSTGRLASNRHMKGVYDIMGYMTNDDGISTIGLAAMAGACKEAILKQHPQLAEVDDSYMQDMLDSGVPAAVAVEEWVNDLRKKFGNTLEVQPMDVQARSLEDDMDYIAKIRGNTDNVIVLNTSS